MKETDEIYDGEIPNDIQRKFRWMSVKARDYRCSCGGYMFVRVGINRYRCKKCHRVHEGYDMRSLAFEIYTG